MSNPPNSVLLIQMHCHFSLYPPTHHRLSPRYYYIRNINFGALWVLLLLRDLGFVALEFVFYLFISVDCKLEAD